MGQRRISADPAIGRPSDQANPALVVASAR